MAKFFGLLIAVIMLISIGAAANSPPGAPTAPAGTTSGVIGTSYSYSTSSIDPNGDQVKYTFYWSDGSASYVKLSPSGATASASHVWAANGVYNVYVKAIDSKYAASPLSPITQVTIGQVVANRPPLTPSIPSGPTSGTSGAPCSYATSATDPDGNQVKYTFSWGDGTTTTTGLIDSGISATGSHAWTVAAGTSKTFQVTAIATDALGLSSGSSGALAVTIAGQTAVNNPPAKPSIPGGDLAGRSGKTYSYVTKATDPDGDKIKITFDWGDGTSTTSDLAASGSIASAFHAWTVAPGTVQTFLLRSRATDEHGAVSAWCGSMKIMILAPKPQNPPTIPTKPIGPTSCVSGTSYAFSTSSTDPDGDMIMYLWDFGDGNGIESDYFSSGQVVTVSHVWTVPAGMTYIRQVRAISIDGRNMMDPAPHYSDPLVVTISG